MQLNNSPCLIAAVAVLMSIGGGSAGASQVTGVQNGDSVQCRYSRDYPPGYPQAIEARSREPGANQLRPAPITQRSDPTDTGPPPATGPSGTSGAGDNRYDEVGYATWYGEELSGNRTSSGDRFDPNAFTAAHRTLPLGSFVEVTSLDTGHTILVLINDRGPTDPRLLIDLSHGAAKALGVDRKTAVRVRRVVPPPSDVTAIRSGQAAGPRLDTPPVMLTALKSRLPDMPVTTVAPAPPPPPAQPSRAPIPPASVPTRQSAPISSPGRPLEESPSTSAKGHYFVQIAALSNKPRAFQLAKSLAGLVSPAGVMWRVRLGPYLNASQAAQARDAAARRGYGDARVVRED